MRTLLGTPDRTEPARPGWGPKRPPVQNQVSSNDATVVRLFCVWVFLLCFQYQPVPMLQWNLGISMTPDRLAVGLLLIAYARRTAHTIARPGSGTMAAVMLEPFMLLFALVGTVSWLVSGADAGNDKFRWLTTLFSLSFLPTVSYFVARRLQYTRAMLKEILLFLAALGVYLSFTSVCEHYEATSLVFPKYILDPTVGIQFGRSRGPFLDTIGNGGMLLVSFLVFTCLSSSLTGFKRALTILLTLFVVPAIYFTETRMIWLGLAAVTAILLSLRTTMRRTAVIVGCATLIGFLSGIGGKFSPYENTLFARRQDTVENRIDNYEITWAMFKKNPVFGIGYGRFRSEWSNYFDEETALTTWNDGNHSTIMGILAELGIIGFTTFVAILACSVMVCITAYRHLREDRWEVERRFVVVGLCAVISFFLLGLTNDLRSVAIVNVSAFWFVGIVSSIHSGYLASMGARRWRGTQPVVTPKGAQRGSVFSI